MSRAILLIAVILASTTSRSQIPPSPGTVITIAGNGLVAFSGDGGPATNASLNQITGLAYGRDGTLYIADEGNLRIRAVDPATKIIRTIAGTGNSGDEGNGGPATSANIGGVIGIATDHARNALYLTDWPNNWVRKVNLTDGTISAYAGSRSFGMSGDGGPATLAKLSFPIDAATDGSGRLSFVDSANKRICRVDPVTGIISTIAGSAGLGPTGDGGPATSAALGNAIRLAADPAGNVYIRDGDPSAAYFTVRRVDAVTGIITTIVGGGSNPEGTGVATSMHFKNIEYLAANGDGELFVATPLRVYKLNMATGIIAPFAGDGVNGVSTEGDPALTARFSYITSIAVAPDGGLVIGDTDNSRVRLVTPQPKQQPTTSSDRVVAIAGNGTVGFSGDGGPAINASFNIVQGLAFGPDGTLYMSDTGNLRIRALDPLTGNIRTVAGTGAVGDEGNGGPAIDANMAVVIGLATDRTRNVLYLPEAGNFWVRKVNLADGIINVFAGAGAVGFTGDGGPATSARVRRAVSAATDALGRFYFSDIGNWRIRRVDPASGIINTVAGNGTLGVPSGDGGPATSATLGSPLRLTVDPAGNIYLRDGDPNSAYFTVRRIDATTGIITTIVGGGSNPPGAGVATSMFFDNIVDVAANDSGELFIATPIQIFKLNIATGLLAPFAGDGVSGPTTNNIPALTARFAEITALAVAPGGGVIVADASDARVYYIPPDSIILSGDSAQTSFTVPWLSGVSGNLILEDNPNLTTINLASLTTVTGDLVLDGNTAAGVLDLGSLETVSGDVTLTDNTATTSINLASLATVSGDLTLENNGAAGILDLGSLETVSGDLTIEESTSGNLDLSSLAEVSGDVTLTSNESGNLDLSTLTGYGCGTNEVTMTLDGSFAMTNGLTLCTNATLAGSSTVDGSITNNGTIEPGSSPGRLNILRNLHLGATSRLNLEIGGYAQNQIDTINVGGNVVLGGTLKVRLLDTFTGSMTNGASFTVLTSSQPLTGAFANVASGATLTTEDGRARFTVLYAGQNSVQLTDLQINNEAPQLRILSITQQPGALRITWTAVPGTTYRVQSATNLQDGFIDQSPSITASPTDTTLRYHAPTSPEIQFFRLRTLP